MNKELRDEFHRRINDVRDDWRNSDREVSTIQMVPAILLLAEVILEAIPDEVVAPSPKKEKTTLIEENEG